MDTINMEKLKQDLLELINSIEFQELNSYYSERTLFSILNAERNENRHSAFVSWWLNPKSEHGLGDAPLKLFFRLIASKNSDCKVFEGDFYLKILSGQYRIEIIEDFKLEKSTGVITSSSNKNRMDIWAVLKLSYEKDTGEEEMLVVPFCVENKIYSKEGDNQTKNYYRAMKSYIEDRGLSNNHTPLGVFLTPKYPTKKLSSDEFIIVRYQELLSYVIEPLVSSVASDKKTFVESFIKNLGTPSGEAFGIIAVSQNEKTMIEKLQKYNEIFVTALVLLYSATELKSLMGKDEYEKVHNAVKNSVSEYKVLLSEIWDAYESIFISYIYYKYGNDKKSKEKLNKLFKASHRDTSRYKVYYVGEGKEVTMMSGKRLFKSMAATAIAKAYLMENPHSTLDDLRNAFPLKKLSSYSIYYDYSFYLANDEKCKDSWAFYRDEKTILTLESGEKVRCIKMWRKGDFDKLMELVKKNYSTFIKIEKC